SMSGSHNQGVARGTLLEKQGAVPSTGATGTALEISGGIRSDAALYSHFHVLDACTTVTAVFYSSDSDEFQQASTMATHSALTTVGANIQRVAGPITDEFFRVRVTAITGSFSVACAIGVGV